MYNSFYIYVLYSSQLIIIKNKFLLYLQSIKRSSVYIVLHDEYVLATNPNQIETVTCV